jgi:hypothetical protein
MPTQTTVTALITDPSGTLATSGTVTFVLQPKSSAQLYYVKGTSILAPTEVAGVINASGQLKAEDGVSPLLLWGNNTISPTETFYRAIIAPNGVVAQTVNLLLINGASYDLSNPVFFVPALVEPNTNPPTFQQMFTSLVPGAAGQYSLGTSQYPYASGYINQIFGTEITLTGNATFKARYKNAAMTGGNLTNISTVEFDVPGCSVSLDSIGIWMVLATFDFTCIDLLVNDDAQALGYLNFDGSDQSALATMRAATNTSIVTVDADVVAQQWFVNVVTSPKTAKLRAKAINGGTAQVNLSSLNTGIKAIYLGTA